MVVGPGDDSGSKLGNMFLVSLLDMFLNFADDFGSFVFALLFSELVVLAGWGTRTSGL